MLVGREQELAAMLRALPGVREGASRFGPAGRLAWSVGGREFAHLQGDHLIDL